MKSKLLLMLLLSAMLVMSACSKNNDKQEHAPTETPVVKTEASSSAPVEQEESEPVTDEQSLAVQYLTDALNKIKQQDVISYYATTASIFNYIAYDDSAAPLQNADYASYSGTMDRHSLTTHISSYHQSLVFDNSNAGGELLEEHIREYESYISPEHDYLYNDLSFNEWHQMNLEAEVQSIQHIEDLIQFFLDHHTQLVGEELIVEGGGEEVELYRQVTLNFTTEQFVNNTSFLRSNFFFGDIDSEDQYSDQTFYIFSPELTGHSIKLYLDTDNNLTSFEIQFSTPGYEGESTDDETYDFYGSISFFEEDTVKVVTVPDEVVNSIVH